MEAYKIELHPRLRHPTSIAPESGSSICPATARFLPSSGLISSRWAQLSYRQRVLSLQIEGQADQPPLTRRRLLAPQRELAEAEYFLNEPNHWLDRAFPQSVNRVPYRRAQFVAHLLFRTGITRRRCRRLREIDCPIPVMWLAPRGDVRGDPAAFPEFDI